MLLITRRIDESIVINGTIEVKIVDVKGGRVKLGFEYPEGNTVYRQELYEKIMSENRQAVANIAPEKLGNFLKNLSTPQAKNEQKNENPDNGNNDNE